MAAFGFDSHTPSDLAMVSPPTERRSAPDRIGPYEVEAELRSIPGARFLSARALGGEPVVLQVVFLRPARGRSADREEEALRLARATAHHIGSGASLVSSHGSSDLVDGRRALFWQLREQVPPPAPRPIAAERWCMEAEALLGRLLARHRAGTRAPLLTEFALFEGREGLDWFGVPVATCPVWVGLGAPPPRVAPGERSQPTEQGDLWRLGRALAGVGARDVGGPPWARWLEGLEYGRFDRAEDALDALPSRAKRARSLTREAVATESVERCGALESAIPLLRSMSVAEQAAVDALAMSWSNPSLGTGESPWSDVEPMPSAAPEPDSGVFTAPHSALVASPVREAPPSAFDGRRWVPGVLAALALSGGLVFAARRAGEASGQDRPASVEAVVRLESDPPGARVLAASDGRELGRAPVELWGAPAGTARVLVALEGYDPVGLTLPERGAVAVRLEPVDVGAGCRVELELDAAAESWPGGEPVERSLRIVGGGTVVRAKPGKLRGGAALVTCAGPRRGGPVRVAFDAPLAERRLRVAGPSGALVFIDGRPVGVAPVEVRARGAFVLVRVERDGVSVERWVSLERDIEFDPDLGGGGPPRG